MDWLLIGGCIVAAWALLSVLGGERQRLINELPLGAPSTPTPSKALQKSAPPNKH